MRTTINEIPLQQLPTQHIKVHKVIKINPTISRIVKNLAQTTLSETYQKSNKISI